MSDDPKNKNGDDERREREVEALWLALRSRRRPPPMGLDQLADVLALAISYGFAGDAVSNDEARDLERVAAAKLYAQLQLALAASKRFSLDERTRASLRIVFAKGPIRWVKRLRECAGPALCAQIEEFGADAAA